MVRRACVHMSAAHCLVFRPSPPPPPTKGGSPACALPGHCLTACAPGDWSSMFCLQCHFNKHKHRCVAGHMLSLTFSVRLCVRKIRLRGCVYLGPATAWLPRGAPYTPTPAPTHTSGHAPCGGAAQSTTGLHPGVRHRTQGTAHRAGHLPNVSAARPHQPALTRGCQVRSGTHVPTSAGLPLARVTCTMTAKVRIMPAGTYGELLCARRVCHLTALGGRHLQICTLQLRKLRSGRSLHPQVPKSETMRAWEK